MYTHNAPDPDTTRHRPGGVIGRGPTSVVTEPQPDTVPPKEGDYFIPPKEGDYFIPPPNGGSIDLIAALEQAWAAICVTYDVNAGLPDTQCLFEGADPRAPWQAAEAVIANMLLGAMEEVGRFSPAYRKPIGLIHVRDQTASRSSWLLSPETRGRWQSVITPLALSIEKNVGVLLAADVLGELLKSGPCDESRVTACCLCVPPRVIMINRAALGHANIVCETCQQPFHLIEPPEADDWEAAA